MVKKAATAKDKLLKVLIIVGVVLIFFISNMAIPMFGMFISLAVGFGAYIILGRLKKEFEYSFTNGELDIDVIYNKSSRKRLFNGNVKDFEIMAHVEDKSHENTFSTANERLDFSTGTVSDNSYVFLTNYKGKRTAVVIEPNDEMLASISKILTRRRFHPKK
jgi:membrane-bound ClpP family serine protease